MSLICVSHFTESTEAGHMYPQSHANKVEILKSQLITQSTAYNGYTADFQDIWLGGCYPARMALEEKQVCACVRVWVRLW